MSREAGGTPEAFYWQAMFFLEAAMAVSKDVAERKEQEPIFNNYEFVIVGTHHAFASELLLKGIMLHDGITPPRGADGHNLSVLLSLPEMGDLKNKISTAFSQLPSRHVDASGAIYASYNSQHPVGSFDYFLEFHAKHFIDIRYACEGVPKGLDMNFTSFLCGELKNELKKKIDTNSE